MTAHNSTLEMVALFADGNLDKYNLMISAIQTSYSNLHVGDNVQCGPGTVREVYL